MFNKPILSLELSDIENLVNTTKTPEGQHTEYKRELDPSNDGKKELAKDISALANSGGGDLIIGIDEADGLPTTITGTPRHIGRQRADEWINAIISSGTDPKVDYSVKLIDHATESDKVIAIVGIRDSSRKPHMVTINKRNVYYRRHLDITSPATHQEVRDMFYESQATAERLREYLSDRMLLDDRMTLFANTKHSRELMNDMEDDWRKRPHVAYSLVPMQLRDGVADPAVDPLRSWLGAHANGHAPIASKEIYYQHESRIDIEGITFYSPIYREQVYEGYKRYLELNGNGYIEAGLSRDIFWMYSHGGEHHPIMHLSNTLAYAEALIRFAVGYYREIGLEDRIYYQISVANIRGFALGGFDSRPRGGRGWAAPYSPYNDEPPVVQNYDNFKVGMQFDPEKLDDAAIAGHMADLATQLSRAFGLTTQKAYAPDGSLDPLMLRSFL